ncbi:lysophospholipid acyltransferase family protein [Bdellovibrio sp. HCB2-146]|uniref:lysophospholipid acyltransferase family protein n=1 Tax=Bdellovibrio sp. HCB2-146 TaxID=3394362 RepID=UPI0039BC6D30
MKDWDYENEQWTKLPTYLKHLPLFTRHIDIFSVCVRFVWSIILKNLFFKFYIRLTVKGTTFKELYKTQPKLIIISNHASHLDAVSIAASIPRVYWLDVYIAAAKDYFFTNPLFTFFSQHCLGAIPIDRKDRKGEAINLILKLLTELPRMWLIIFPEGTRSRDGKVQEFKRGVSIFSERTQTPLLFTYLEGNAELWPKGRIFAVPGKLVLHVGPVHPPGPIEQVYTAYKSWVMTINPHAFHVKEEEPKEAPNDSEQI